MEILENLAQWTSNFKQGWLEHVNKTGQIDWTKYQWPKNSSAPLGKAKNLSSSRLAIISTAGAFVKNSQKPFDASSLIGDYSIRTFSISTPFERLDYAHEHYNHDARRIDPQVNLPLRLVEQLFKEGTIGSLADKVISFCGYQPDVSRVVSELIPQILETVREQNAEAAFLIPV